MLRAAAEDFHAVGPALRSGVGAGRLGKVRPGFADAVVAIPGVVVDKGGIGAGLDGGGSFQQLAKDSAVAEHTGHTGHHAVGGVVGVLGGAQHIVHIGLILGPQGQGLDRLVLQVIALEIVPPGGILCLVTKDSRE